MLDARFAHCSSTLLRRGRGEKDKVVQIAVFPIIFITDCRLIPPAFISHMRLYITYITSDLLHPFISHQIWSHNLQKVWTPCYRQPPIRSSLSLYFSQASNIFLENLAPNDIWGKHKNKLKRESYFFMPWRLLNSTYFFISTTFLCYNRLKYDSK